MRSAARSERAELRPAVEPRIVQVHLVVAQHPVVGQRPRRAARFRKDQLPGRRIPFIGVGRAHVIVDPTLGQQAELVRTPLLDNL